MDGLIYLLNQAGLALADASQTIAKLNAEIERLQKPNSE